MKIELDYSGEKVKACCLGNDGSFGVALLEEKLGNISIVHYDNEFKVIREYK